MSKKPKIDPMKSYEEKTEQFHKDLVKYQKEATGTFSDEQRKEINKILNNRNQWGGSKERNNELYRSTTKALVNTLKRLELTTRFKQQ